MKAQDFIKFMAEADKTSPIEKLAIQLKNEGDARLEGLVKTGKSALNIEEAGLLILALNLHQNGDDRLWDELGVDKLIKE